MVHALEEAVRVVTRDGCVLDLRPLAFDLPFEVETPGGVEQIGYAGGAPGLAADFACLRAERAAVSQQLLTRDEVRYLTFALFWKTREELTVFLAEHWQSAPGPDEQERGERRPPARLERRYRAYLRSRDPEAGAVPQAEPRPLNDRRHRRAGTSDRGDYSSFWEPPAPPSFGSAARSSIQSTRQS